MTLFYDLEIAPLLGWAYDVWDANIIRVERSPYIMCFAYKWLGDGGVQAVAQPDFPKWYADEPYDDHFVVLNLHMLLDAADVVVAHNANKFDNKVAAARFLDHGMRPPSPYKTVDTLTAARRFFRLGNNSLDKLCQRLGVGEKTQVRHHDLWPACIDGDMEAWEQMVTYCKRDVELLEGLYTRLAPYMTNHPNVAHIGSRKDACPRCGSDKLQYRGYAYTNVSTFRRLQCTSCGAWSRERLSTGDRPTVTNAA